MIPDRNRIYDGWVSLEAGVDAGRTATVLDPNQCESAENMTFRGGTIGSRPGFRKLTESFTNPTHSYYGEIPRPGYLEGEDAIGDIIVHQQASEIYRDGIMQCAIGFSPHGHEDCIMAMIGGRLFKIVPQVSTASVTEITPIKNDSGPDVFTETGKKSAPAMRNKSDLPIAYMVQADKWLVVQDGDSKAIVYDGVSARRANIETTRDKTEIPTGTILAYGMGRIVTVVNERDIAFGDLQGSHALPDASDSLVFFTERNFLAEGFDASIPFQNGSATGMAFFPQLDTSTGNGQLLVFSERGASSFFLSLPREQWKTSQFQIFALITTGLRGHRSISAVNEDLWFRADDGVRSYRQARSEPSGWAHIPLSTNVKQFVGVDTDRWLKFASSIYFDNRIIFTCSPAWNQGRPFHSGMVVVDFDILSSFGQRFRPAWEGHWTFPNDIKVIQIFTGIFNGVTRAFAFCLDENGQNQLYEITKDDRDDWDGQKIEWEMVSRAFDFQKLAQQGSAFGESELYDGDVWLRDIIE